MSFLDDFYFVQSRYFRSALSDFNNCFFSFGLSLLDMFIHVVRRLVVDMTRRQSALVGHGTGNYSCNHHSFPSNLNSICSKK